MSQKRPRPPIVIQQPPPGGAGEPPGAAKPIHVGRLERVSDWRRQIGKIYREMRRGELPHEQGTRLTYVAQIGAQLAKVEEEIRDRDELLRQLAAIKGHGQSLDALQLSPASDNQESSQ